MNEILKIFSRVKFNKGCWEWVGTIDIGGYGRIYWRGKSKPAHRIVYETLGGKVPAGLVIDHLCRNRRCVNPSHLEVTTQKINVLRGVGTPAMNAKKTHCPQGHEYSPTNTRFQSGGGRECWVCRRLGRAKYRRRKALGNKLKALAQSVREVVEGVPDIPDAWDVYQDVLTLFQAYAKDKGIEIV